MYLGLRLPLARSQVHLALKSGFISFSTSYSAGIKKAKDKLCCLLNFSLKLFSPRGQISGVVTLKGPVLCRTINVSLSCSVHGIT